MGFAGSWGGSPAVTPQANRHYPGTTAEPIAPKSESVIISSDKGQGESARVDPGGAYAAHTSVPGGTSAAANSGPNRTPHLTFSGRGPVKIIEGGFNTANHCANDCLIRTMQLKAVSISKHAIVIDARQCDDSATLDVKGRLYGEQVASHLAIILQENQMPIEGPRRYA
jgi:hypothetical protein